MEKPSRPEGLTRRPLEYVAFWQAMAFLLLICAVWTTYVFDLTDALYPAGGADSDWYRSWLLTAVVILVGFISVAHTYVQEQRILRGLLVVCSYCHKIQLDRQAWQQMETYVADRTMVEFSHGVCPSCYEKVVRKIDHPATETLG